MGYSIDRPEEFDRVQQAKDSSPSRAGRLAAARIRLRCPMCAVPGGTLEEVEAVGKSCASCGFRFAVCDGIVWAMPAHRQRVYARFAKEYSLIRKAEGRGSEDAAYYLALPCQDMSGRNSAQWSIRSKTYRYFERKILPQFESARGLDILDLGAGNGWLSYRLAKREHLPVAVDILTDPRDGLGAARHFGAELGGLFPLVAAEFDNLPFSDGQFDLAIFNSSLHYSADYVRTIAETRRCLKPGGSMIVLDSPLYRCCEHGERMRAERHEYFEAKYGFRSDSVPSVEFLHDAILEELASELHLRWKVHRPWYGWRWHLRPLRARLMGARPPSRFQILVGSWPT
ncbi:MAG TPA: class I SAM-dependent methyltransferase [Acidobacteriota bacterium]|nr:class I SAM-dependent methyltransferase [Acidobacteriota bacterium]